MKSTLLNSIKAFLIINLFFISNLSIAQANEGFTYQAVIRNSSGALVANTAVGVKISLLQGSAGGPVLFSERQTATTNANGLVTFVITDGTLISGSFSAIDWGNAVVFLKTETDPTGGTNYTISGTSQLKSVPFANYANEVGNAWKPTGNAVGSNEFIGSTNDVDVVFKRNNVKAGFIGQNNVALGRTALNNTAPGDFNVALGSDALAFNTGSFNVATGFESQYVNNSGTANTSYGSSSLRNNSTESYNTAIGFESLRNTTGGQNTAVGWGALSNVTTGGGNIGIGKLVSVPAPTANDQLSIGNVIYGTNMGDTTAGTIGIGVPVPTEKLEVAGKTKTTNLQVTTGAGVNKVLTSDAIGNATWQNSNANTGIDVYKYSSQIVPSGSSYVTIEFDTESTDDASAYNPTTSEWTIPSDGFYHIYATARFSNYLPANTIVSISIYVNGGALKAKKSIISGQEGVDVTADIKLMANSKVKIRINQDSGADAYVGNSGGRFDVYFTGYKIY